MSTPSVLPNFIRKWQIDIDTGMDSQGNEATTTLSSSDFGNAALRATFDCGQFGYRAFWYGDITIYNLDVLTMKRLLGERPQDTSALNEGMLVTVSAGYENGNYGKIFVGKVLQSFVEREDVTDYKTILHCVAGRPEMVNNFMNFSLDGKPTPEQILQYAVTHAGTKLSLDYVKNNLTMDENTMSDPSMSDSKRGLDRGFVCFSDAGTFFDMYAKDQELLWWFDGDKVSFSDFGSPDSDAIIVSPPALHGGVTPAPGTLIGTPQQTQYGCVLRVLLDPRFRVKTRPVQIKLDMSSMVHLKQIIGQQVNFLDGSGLYVIGGVRHYGDTRGNAWYSEAVCYTTVGGKLGMLTASADRAVWARQQYPDQQ